MRQDRTLKREGLRQFKTPKEYSREKEVSGQSVAKKWNRIDVARKESGESEGIPPTQPNSEVADQEEGSGGHQ